MEQSKEGCMGEFGGRKGKGKWFNYVIISKHRRNSTKSAREIKDIGTKCTQ